MILETLAKALDLAKRAEPYAEAILPLLDALEDGRLTSDEVVALAKDAMTRAARETLEKELPP